MTTVDDIDGSEDAKTIEFGLDGVGYEIDLSKNNADLLREALSPYVAHAQKVSSTRRQAGAKGSSAGGTSKVVRAWAVANGID
ncbi:MAG: histone-like nucleoid-structuring protein Lsr2, partial [Pseudonocardiaceae bacterium]